VSDEVYSISRDPEAFGRVSLEAASLGRPEIGSDHGGVAEQLAALFPQGAVPLGDEPAVLVTTLRLLCASETTAAVNAPFTVEAMGRATLSVYSECLDASAASAT